jgi:hypothetical protein
MGAAPVLAVAATAPLDRQHGKAFSLEHRKIFPYCLSLRAMHRDPHLVQPGKRSRSDTSNNNSVYFLIIERLHRVARAMRVVLVPIVDRRNTFRVRIDHNKYRGRAKVIVHGALNAIIILDREADLHVMFLLCMVRTTIIQIR